MDFKLSTTFYSETVVDQFSSDQTANPEMPYVWTTVASMEYLGFYVLKM